MSQVVVLIIQEYLQTSIDQISEWRGYSFAQRSYSKWAAKELIKYLENNPEDPPLVVIEAFRDKMDTYAKANKQNSYIFSVAYDVAENIIDLLL